MDIVAFDHLGLGRAACDGVVGYNNHRTFKLRLLR